MQTAFRSCKREGCKLYNQSAIDVSVACVISSYDMVHKLFKRIKALNLLHKWLSTLLWALIGLCLCVA